MAIPTNIKTLLFETDDDRSYFITRLFGHEKFVDNSGEELKRSQKGAEKGS